MHLELLSIVAPVFLCTALGWAWTRAGRPYDTAVMTALISNIGAPCLVFSRLVSLEVDPALMAQMAGAAVLAMLALGALGLGVLRLWGLPVRTFLAPMMFGNAGNMGMAVCLFAYGAEGLALGVCFFTVWALGQFTLGVWLWAGRVSAAELLATPLAWAALLAVVLIATRSSVPGWILRTTDLLGGFTIPLMLMTLGASLARLGIHGVGRTVALSALRLGLGFGVGMTLAHGLAFEGIARGVLILQCSMPVAVFNYLFAQLYGRSPEQVASLVLLSTLISYVTLPVLLAYLL